MFEAALTALAQSPLAIAINGWRHGYPLINAAHILSLATLFGSIVALDLRLLGLMGRVPVQPLATALPPVAAAGLAGAAITGLLLISVDPHEYAANPAFRLKLLLVALGATHALAVHRSSAWRALHAGGAITSRLQVAAAVSLSIWTGAIVAGRFIAF